MCKPVSGETGAMSSRKKQNSIKLKSLKTKKADSFKANIQNHSQKKSSIHPSPELLRQIVKDIPNAKEELFNLFVEEQRARIVVGKNHIENDKKGQLFAFIIALSGVIAGITCALLGETAIGTIVGGGAVVIAPFFLPEEKKKDLKEKLTKQTEIFRMLKGRETD